MEFPLLTYNTDYFFPLDKVDACSGDVGMFQAYNYFEPCTSDMDESCNAVWGGFANSTCIRPGQ